MLAGKLPVSNNKLQQLKFKIINHKPPSNPQNQSSNLNPTQVSQSTNCDSTPAKSFKQQRKATPPLNIPISSNKQLYYIHTIHFSNYYNNLTPLAKPIHKYNTSMNSSKAMLYSVINGSRTYHCKVTSCQPINTTILRSAKTIITQQTTINHKTATPVTYI
eukprot:gene3484-2435_t